MKFMKFSTDLPIEAIESVISILASMIAMVKDRNFLLGSDGLVEHNESVEYLTRDLNDCRILYESWLEDDAAPKYERQLAIMHTVMLQAEATLNEARQVALH